MSEHRPTVAVETVRPFKELFAALEQTGFRAEHRAPLEQRSDAAVQALAIYIIEKLADPEIEQLVAAVRAWAPLGCGRSSATGTGRESRSRSTGRAEKC